MIEEMSKRFGIWLFIAAIAIGMYLLSGGLASISLAEKLLLGAVLAAHVVFYIRVRPKLGKGMAYALLIAAALTFGYFCLLLLQSPFGGAQLPSPQSGWVWIVCGLIAIDLLYFFVRERKST